MKHHLFSDISTGLKFVAIGGGNGLSTLLSGLKKYVNAEENEPVWIEDLVAVVAVTDDGGSSGRLREELQMLPPGDIRNCMVALSEDSRLLSKLFRHRFRGEGELGGHSFGNLFLAAMCEITGDFAEAIKLSSEILASKGHIYPATVADVRLAAELDDGSVVKGETNISQVGQRIKRLALEPPDCKPMGETLAAIAAADVITVGPGSLYTSLLPPVLVEGVADAIAAAKGIRIFVCNLMTQPGETDGLTARRHLEIFKEYAPQINFDYLVVNDTPISSEQAEKYAGEGAEQIGVHGSVSPETVEGAEIVYGNLLDDSEMVRHHPDKLAQVTLLCALQPRSIGFKTGRYHRDKLTVL
ncbi:MAG: uridine diphosphate-N-acetylglucosamine-binding protein YvcK [Acidobacteria bacterium]|nr:uridine diphosphate-N-acetylglucosamine-binding protein YvcK [Acidobacteriota bacterium]